MLLVCGGNRSGFLPTIFLALFLCYLLLAFAAHCLICCCLFRRSDLSLEEFQLEYEGPGRPVIIAGVVPKWPAAKLWSKEYLAKALAGREVRGKRTLLAGEEMVLS